MLLKNLDLKADLTNGIRLIIKNIFRHLEIEDTKQQAVMMQLV